MRVLVTGGAGFIGSHVVDQLVDRGDDVVVLDSLSPAAHQALPSTPTDHQRGSAAHPRAPGYLNARADYHFADLRDPDAVAAAARGTDAVCHMAARVGLERGMGDAPEYISDNDVGTGALLAVLAGSGFFGRLVLASSMVVYGEGAYRCPDHGGVRPPPRDEGDLARGLFEARCPVCAGEVEPVALAEDSPLDPRNVYAATKLHQEHLCAVYGRLESVPVTALRYHNVYGSRMPRGTPYAGVASIFATAVAEGDAPRVFEDGKQMRDFVHVSDVARATVMAITAPVPYDGALNIASGSPRSVGEIAEAMAAAGRDPSQGPVVTGAFRLGDVRHIVASPKRAEEALGFRAEVPFGDGMAELAHAAMREPAQS